MVAPWRWLLAGSEGITSVDEVVRIAEEVWGAGMLREDTLFTLRVCLAERGLAG